MHIYGNLVRPELRRMAIWRRWRRWRQRWRWQKWVWGVVRVRACPNHIQIWRWEVELMQLINRTKNWRRKRILLHHRIFFSMRLWKHWRFLMDSVVRRVQLWWPYLWSQKTWRAWQRRKWIPGEPSATVSPWVTWSRLLHWLMNSFILTLKKKQQKEMKKNHTVLVLFWKD